MRLLVFSLLSLALSTPARSQDAYLLHTGDTHSFLEVCGCSEGQLGGVARRATLVERQRAGGEPLLLVDAGGFVEGEEALDHLRVETYARAMVQLGTGRSTWPAATCTSALSSSPSWPTEPACPWSRPTCASPWPGWPRTCCGPWAAGRWASSG